jgi:arsenite methyltransferase
MKTARRSLILLLLALLAGTAHADDRDEWQQPERVVADLSLRPGMVAADVGCGEGYFAFRLAQAVGEQGRLFAVDINQGALRTVRTRAEKDHVLNLEVIRSDPTDTKLVSGSLDVALLCDVLHEVPSSGRQPLLQDIARALKPGAYLYLIDYRKIREVPFGPYDRLIPKEDLLGQATQAGLTIDAEYHYLRYQVFFRLRKPPQP